MHKQFENREAGKCRLPWAGYPRGKLNGLWEASKISIQVKTSLMSRVANYEDRKPTAVGKPRSRGVDSMATIAPFLTNNMVFADILQWAGFIVENKAIQWCQTQVGVLQVTPFNEADDPMMVALHRIHTLMIGVATTNFNVWILSDVHSLHSKALVNDNALFSGFSG